MIKCDHSDHNPFYSSYDKDFVDQEQCELIFHTWNLQINMLLETTLLRDMLAEISENNIITLVPREHLTVKILKNQKEVFFRKRQLLELEYEVRKLKILL